MWALGQRGCAAHQDSRQVAQRQVKALNKRGVDGRGIAWCFQRFDRFRASAAHDLHSDDLRLASLPFLDQRTTLQAFLNYPLGNSRTS